MFNLDSKYILTIILLMLGVLYSAWLLFVENGQQQSLSPTDQNQSDSYIYNVHAIQINRYGKVHSEMTSPKVRHYPANDTADLEKPAFIIYSDNDEQPWYIDANKGKTIEGITQLHLWDHVKIYQPVGIKNNTITITTSALTIFPKQNFATTNQAIQFIEPGIKVNAVGMNAYMKKKRIELLSQSRGVYDPSSYEKNTVHQFTRATNS